MNGRFRMALMLLLCMVLALVFGCGKEEPSSQGTESAEPKEKAFQISTEPVSLTFFVHAVRLTDQEFQKFFVDQLKQKYPFIQLERLTGNINELVASGNTPDIVLSDSDWYSVLGRLDIPLDLTDYIRKFQIDLDRFLPTSVQAIRQLTPSQQMTALPFAMNTGAFFYNKDIFDKFAVTYPKEGMTWGEVLDLSRRLTQTRDGMQYIGWDPLFPDVIASPYTLPFIDPATMKAVIDIPVYKKVFDLIKQVYDQPGYLGPNAKFQYGDAGFIKDQNVAMLGEWTIKMMGTLLEADEQGISPNWDLTTIPNFEDRAGMGRHSLTSLLVVSNQSKHKDQAMQVLQLMTTKEVQNVMSRDARITVLNDKEIEAQYGLDKPTLKNKNVASIFKFKPSPAPLPHEYDKDIQPFIRQARKAIAEGTDVNTALRLAQEGADKKIRELQAQ